MGSKPTGLLQLPMYLGASFEAGNVWQSRDDISLGTAQANGSIFAGLDTTSDNLYTMLNRSARALSDSPGLRPLRPV